MRKDDVRDPNVVDDSACLQDNPVFETLPDFQPGNPYIPLIFAAPGFHRGYQVAACLDPPDAIKEICKKLHVAKGKMSSQGTDVNDHVDANIEHVLDGQDAEKVSSQSHMDVDINVGPSMKKAKLSSDKNTLAKAWQMQARKAATVALQVMAKEVEDSYIDTGLEQENVDEGMHCPLARLYEVLWEILIQLCGDRSPMDQTFRLQMFEIMAFLQAPGGQPSFEA
ncbi:hypothetical protein L7F22_035861 [Adiantum nelumboides]|nr:hypothetical protein [Adiantum nelumboides]